MFIKDDKSTKSILKNLIDDGALKKGDKIMPRCT